MEGLSRTCFVRVLSESVGHVVIVLALGDSPSAIHGSTCALSGHWVSRIRIEKTPCEAGRLCAGIVGFSDVPRGCGSLQVPAPELRPWRGGLAWFGTADPIWCVFYSFFVPLLFIPFTLLLPSSQSILLRPSRTDDSDKSNR